MSLYHTVHKLLAKKKVVLLGVGNPDRGDDGLGPSLVERLAGNDRMMCINCETVPENYTGVVRDARPQVILFIDAVDFGGHAGETIILRTEELPQQRRFNTHHASLALVMDYLHRETGAQVWLLGVQPKSTAIGEPMSPEIEEMTSQLAYMLRKIADEDRI